MENIKENKIDSYNFKEGVIDFSRLDFENLCINQMVLKGINFSYSNLKNAIFSFVDLTNVMFNDANLNNSRFEFCYIGSGIFDNADAQNIRFENCTLDRATFINAKLEKAIFRTCSIESVNFFNSDLNNSTLVYSNFGQSNFSNANLLWANTYGSLFESAELKSAKNFFLCRELIIEILRHQLNKDDVVLSGLMGAVSSVPQWCYSDWKEILNKYPVYKELAFRIFGEYTESKINQALRIGWNYPSD